VNPLKPGSLDSFYGRLDARDDFSSPVADNASIGAKSPITRENQLPTADISSKFAIGQLDAVEWLRSLNSESVDLVLTDPAYESLEKHRAIGTTTRLKHSKASSNDWFPIFPNSRFPELFDEIHRVLKRNTHFYLFCDAETMFIAKPIAEQSGFRFWKPLVWDKMKIGMGYHYRARHEFILFFEKGKRRLKDLSVPDILTVSRIHNGYPTEKPPALAEILLNQSTSPGDIIADPFCGSGSFGVAALSFGRRFLGNDIKESAVELTRTRLLDVEPKTPELAEIDEPTTQDSDALSKPGLAATLSVVSD
jgi:site-specific DNA-methyltransferase (adenine-specific)